MKNFLLLLKSNTIRLRILCFLFVLNISTFQSQVDWIGGYDIYEKIVVDSNWKYHKGDNLKWAQLDYDDKF